MGGSRRLTGAWRQRLCRALLCTGLALCSAPPLMAQEQAEKMPSNHFNAFVGCPM